MTPIVFLHGWGTDSTSFNIISRFFALTRDCIFIDFNCNPDRAMTLEDYVKFVEHRLVVQRVTHFNIIAHSFGARVAVLLALRNPHMVRKMVLTGAAGIRPKKSFIVWSKIRLYKMFGIGKGSADYAKLSKTGKITFQNIIRKDLKYEISLLKTPTLLIHGTKDKSTPPYMAKRWTKLHGASILKLYRGAGHFAFLDRPEQFISDAHNFLED
jgi:pimeloyl-ACP methyl ester carboxylesterase